MLQKRLDYGSCGHHIPAHGAYRASSSRTDQEPSFESADYHGEYTHYLIVLGSQYTGTSAIVPTDRSCSLQLKKTVMKAVTAFLGSGLRVGVLLQGKKVRDDNKTLRQAGISHDDKLENLGFTLEPNSTQAPQQLTVPEDRHLLDACDVTQPLARNPNVRSSRSAALGGLSLLLMWKRLSRQSKSLGLEGSAM